VARLSSVLHEAGWQRNIDAWDRRLRAIFTGERLRQLPAVEQAMGRQTAALVMQLDAACRAADDVADAAAAAFAEHPDAQILASFPGIGPITGARVLGEIGDDRDRFTDARGLKSYAGSAPITVASGKSLIVRNRKVKHQRLAAAGYVWIFGALPTAELKEHYDRRPGQACRRLAQPIQPVPRLPVPLPAGRPDLRHRQGIPTTPATPRTRRRLTVSKIGCLWIAQEGMYVPGELVEVSG
jgi:transposase IS116/IS110/IS902 family protein